MENTKSIKWKWVQKHRRVTTDVLRRKWLTTWRNSLKNIWREKWPWINWRYEQIISFENEIIQRLGVIN